MDVPLISIPGYDATDLQTEVPGVDPQSSQPEECRFSSFLKESHDAAGPPPEDEEGSAAAKDMTGGALCPAIVPCPVLARAAQSQVAVDVDAERRDCAPGDAAAVSPWPSPDRQVQSSRQDGVLPAGVFTGSEQPAGRSGGIRKAHNLFQASGAGLRVHAGLVQEAPGEGTSTPGEGTLDLTRVRNTEKGEGATLADGDSHAVNEGQSPAGHAEGDEGAAQEAAVQVSQTTEVSRPHDVTSPRSGVQPVRNATHDRGDMTVVRSSDSTLEVHFTVEGIGEVGVEVVLENGAVIGRVSTSDMAGKELIERNLSQLLDALSREGLNVGGFSVSLRNGSDTRGYAVRGKEGTPDAQAPQVMAAHHDSGHTISLFV